MRGTTIESKTIGYVAAASVTILLIAALAGLAGAARMDDPSRRVWIPERRDGTTGAAWGQVPAGTSGRNVASQTPMTPTVYLPVVFDEYATPWWSGIPWCPGEDVDREGEFEDGGNDHNPPDDEIPPFVVGEDYECVGWVHEAAGQLEIDHDRYYFVLEGSQVGSVALRVRLTDLPADYQLMVDDRAVYDPAQYSDHDGTADEEIVADLSVAGPYDIRVDPDAGKVYWEPEKGPYFDPVNPYRLTLEWSQVP